MPIRLAIGLVAGQFRIAFNSSGTNYISVKIRRLGATREQISEKFQNHRAPRTRLRLTHRGRIQPTFEGEFSNVTRSCAGKSAVRYAW